MRLCYSLTTQSNRTSVRAHQVPVWANICSVAAGLYQDDRVREVGDRSPIRVSISRRAPCIEHLLGLAVAGLADPQDQATTSSTVVAATASHMVGLRSAVASQSSRRVTGSPHRSVD